MGTAMHNPPCILLIGGHDPSGGAGLQADIETVFAHACRATSLVTCLTAQDSHNVRALYPQPLEHFQAECEILLADIRPDMVKIGLLGDARLAASLAGHLEQLGCPVVMDPVLAAGGGADLAAHDLLEVIRGRLLPLTTLLTPNRAEARRLGGVEDPGEAAQALLRAGCERVLLTGADEADGGQVRNTLFGRTGREDYTWPRLPYSYHGSGCTLASSIAALLAKGLTLEQAVLKGQKYTWNTLSFATAPGKGQSLPDRFFRYREKQ